MATQRYEYTPLAWNRQIRLLKLHPAKSPDDPALSVDLVPTLLDTAPPFEALSYAWGDPLPRHEIICSGRRFEVGPSLYSALYHLRRLQAPGKRQWMWVDALCINQYDTEEREAQVRMMGDIYSTAYITIIWLGEEDDHTTHAFRWLRRFGKTWRPVQESIDMSMAERTAMRVRLSSNNDAEAYAILRDAFGDRSSQTRAFQDIWMLLRRPWFMRKWVIQEIAKSRNHRIVGVAGAKWMEWVDLTYWFFFLKLSYVTARDFSRSCPWGFEIDDKNADSVLERGSLLAYYSLASALPISHLVAITAIFKCAEPNDHIIALLGIAEEASEFEDLVDYNISTADLCRRLTCAHLTNSVTLKVLWSNLAFVRVERRRKSSWILNVNEMTSTSAVPAESNLIKHPLRMANACGTTKIKATTSDNNLLIRGRIIDFVEQLGQERATKLSDIKRTYDNRFTVEKLNHAACVEWLHECQAIAEAAGQDESGFACTMLIENLCIGMPAEFIAAAKKGFFTYRRNMETLAAAPDESTWLKIMNSLDYDSFRSLNILAGFLGHMRFRRFGRTRHGRIGWMPLVAEEGDQICVFDGMEFPYAVRQAQGSEGNYVLVGDCLIPSLLDGEAMELPGVESVIITIE